MGHGIARLSPSFCCDRMRFRNLGSTEAAFWDRNIIQQPDAAFLPDRDGQSRNAEEQALLNSRLQRFGVANDVCRDALNPGEPHQFESTSHFLLFAKQGWIHKFGCIHELPFPP